MLSKLKLNQFKDTSFVNLMTKRIFNVLLVANPYDAFMLEDDGRIDEKIFNEMVENVKNICEKYSGIPCAKDSGSTDANIPMSLGIPSVCVGNYMGGGMHTREEYMEIASVPVGLKITAEIILQYLQ